MLRGINDKTGPTITKSFNSKQEFSFVDFGDDRKVISLEKLDVKLYKMYQHLCQHRILFSGL